MAETQMVLLTATLPPSEEDRLFQRMFWQREEVTLIRGSTVRPNTAYSVVDGGDGVAARQAQLETIVTEALVDPTQPEGKVLVMCESIAGVEQASQAGLFPCEPYHAKMSDATRAEVLEQFRSGATRVVTATGAFGMGIDIPDIRLLVFMDEPRSMLDYGQTSGRGGRDGLPSRAIVIRGGLEFHDPLVQQYMQGQQCRRIAIDRYLDGNQARVQCQADEEPCDHCQQRMEGERSPLSDRPGTEQVTDGSATVTDRVIHEGGTEWSTHMRGTERPTHQRGTERLTHVPAIARVTHAPESEYIGQVEAQTGRFWSRLPLDSSVPNSRPIGFEGRWREYPSSSSITDQPRPDPEEANLDWVAVEESQAQDRHRRTPEVRRISQAREAAASIDQIVQRLEQWKGRCAVCFRHRERDLHFISQCSSMVGKRAEQERRVAACKGGIVYAKRIVCYRCGLSQGICERWTDGGFRESGQGCQFYGVLIGVVYGIKHAYPRIWGQWWKKGRWSGVDVAGSKQQMQRLGEEAVGQAGVGVWLMHAFWNMTEEVQVEAAGGSRR